MRSIEFIFLMPDFNLIQCFNIIIPCLRPVYTDKITSLAFYYIAHAGVILPELTVGFEQSAYTFYESRQETTPQVCVSVSTESPDIAAVLEITINPDTARGILMWLLFKIFSYSIIHKKSTISAMYIYFWVLRDLWDIMWIRPPHYFV